MFTLLLSAGFFFDQALAAPTNPTARPSPSASHHHSKIHSEVLKELYQVVLLKTPQDRYSFGNWVDSLNQGASIEGVYNGFTHSKEYRDLEKQAVNIASAEALQVFVTHWFYFQNELILKSELKASDAEPLKELDYSTLVDSSKKSSAKKVENPLVLKTENEVKRHFSRASIFTLKRLLGNQALVWASEGRKERENSKFPLRYANWVLETLRSRFDFGLSLRNRADATFHASWASEELKTNRGMLEWEVLNRVHRLLNSAQAVQAKGAKK